MPPMPVDDALTLPVPPARGSGAVQSAHALLGALALLGVVHVVVCPGSRSAPLVYALAEVAKTHGIEAHVRVDERAGAFTALGMSRAHCQHPAAVITTSGTATAHLLAAAMEAHHSALPLILITADRPAELRGTQANQTTVQPDMFAPFTRFNADIPAPEPHRASTAHLRTVVDTAARAFAAAVGPVAGPVHLNLAFRDPLTPSAEEATVARGDECAVNITVAQAIPPRWHGAALRIEPRTLVVAGDAARDIQPLLTRFDLPVVAEPSANVSARVRIPPSALTEVMTDFSHPLRPTHVIVAGHPTLSRPVQRALLTAAQLDISVVSARTDWADAPRRATRILPGVDPDTSSLAHREATQRFTEGWREHVRRVREKRGPLNAAPWQVQAALAVWRASVRANEGAGAPLVLGASALIRDIEEWAHSAPATAVIANRGLAGIDGTISTASGFALASGRRTRVLLGDVSAVHDLTGLVIGPLERQPELDIVVVDDGGGRIFGGLEHAAAPKDLLKRFFTTPHGTDIARAAQALGIPQVHTATPASLPALLEMEAHGRRLIVVREGGV